MPLWGLTDASSNTVKTVAKELSIGSGETAQAANNTALYGNTTPRAFSHGSGPYKMAIGVFGVSPAEVANTGGEYRKVVHAGWNIRRAFTGPVTGVTITAGGTGYSNTDLIQVSGGNTNAAGSLTTNSIGGIITAVLTNPGSGFVNVSSSTIAVTNSIGSASAGSGATLTFTLGGRAGRVTYECIMAAGTLSNGTTDDTYLPQ